MKAIYLTERDVKQLLSIGDALHVVEEAFRQMAAGRVDNLPRRRARAAGVVLHSMSATAEYLGRVGWKEYTTTRKGAKFLVGLYDGASGGLEALIEADWLGRLRTGAATGVAVRHLATAAADQFGLIGCGRQAGTQLEAIAAVRSLSGGRVYCRDSDRRKNFALEMSERLLAEVVPTKDARTAVESSLLVVTTTTSATPVVDSDWVRDGAVVCAVGSNALNRAELDVALVSRAARVVCDQVAACRHESGELAAAAEQGEFEWQSAVELSDVVAGNALGRTNDDEVVVFKSVGLAIEDVALASCLVDKAREVGVGGELD